VCLGIPARLVRVDESHPDLARVDMAGVHKLINIGLLDDPSSLRPGDWLLAHMGFALSLMTAEEARDALTALGEEREAERRAFANREEST
jgi:hydrogenase expression/formation protein HypC